VPVNNNADAKSTFYNTQLAQFSTHSTETPGNNM